MKPGQGQPKPGDKSKQPRQGQPQPGPQQVAKDGSTRSNGNNPAQQSTFAQGGPPQVDISQDIKEMMKQWGSFTARSRRRARRRQREGQSEVPEAGRGLFQGPQPRRRRSSNEYHHSHAFGCPHVAQPPSAVFRRECWKCISSCRSNTAEGGLCHIGYSQTCCHRGIALLTRVR